ncbi:MAG: PqiC family protein [Pseudomonadota bacterium]
MNRRSVLLAALALSACASPQTRYHGLTALAGPSPAPSSLRVGLEPVDVAAFLDRTEIVTRPTPTAVELADRDAWAEPVDLMLGRVLAESLAAELGIAEVLELPTRRLTPLDRVVEVSVQAFNGAAPGEAVLRATWRVYGETPIRLLREGRTDVVEPYDPAGGVPALVAALNATLGPLTAEVADAIRRPPPSS